MIKQSECLVSVITTTYNRPDKLEELYKSLTKQSNKKFEWVLIDDGSDPSTYETVSTFDNFLIKITYIYKENGGKHRALNLALDNIKGNLFIIVDDDDTLTDIAIETIYNDWYSYSHHDIVGISYLRMYPNGKIIGSIHSEGLILDTFYNERYVKRILGDKAEVWLTKAFKHLRFPEFEGELFFPEGYLWVLATQTKQVLFLNKSIYICQYLEGGLSSRGRKLLIENPKAMKIYYLELITNEKSFLRKLKFMIAYNFYDFFDTDNELPIIECRGFINCFSKLFSKLIFFSYKIYEKV
jgi:glycosyltransferase involved in cell wall biosynthesis